MNIGPALAPTTVFTAGFPGMHTFTAVAATGLPGAQFLVNGDGVNNTVAVQNLVTSQLSFTVYLDSGDQLQYMGPAAELYGVRTGNEL